MRSLICSGAKLRCTCGLGVSTLVATPRGVVHPSGRPLATTADHLPIQNITPFAQCMAPPVLARSALSGSPPLCMPQPTGPWTETAPFVQVGSFSALGSDASLCCKEGGLLTIQAAEPSGVSYPFGKQSLR